MSEFKEFTDSVMMSSSVAVSRLIRAMALAVKDDEFRRAHLVLMSNARPEVSKYVQWFSITIRVEFLV